MQDAYHIMQEINWFLKPIKNLILFLFTTRTGIIIFLVLLLLYLFYLTAREVRHRSLLYEAARRRAHFTGLNAIGIFFEQVGKLFLQLINNLTVVLIVLLLLIGIVGLSSAFDTVDKFVQNQQKIQDLKIVVKNLSRNYEVAKIKILNYDYAKNQTTCEIMFYDYATGKYLPNRQKITIKGSKIYVLSLVINFDYSLIETGKKINLALPFKVFSDQVPSKDGILLQIADSTGIPFIYHRNTEQIYGLDSSTYAQRIKEIARYISDEKAARRAGVRSIIAASPHNFLIPRRGQVYKIMVEQTGGLVIKRVESF